MVSLQAALYPKKRRSCPTSRPSDDSSSRKRKWAEGEEGDRHLRAGLANELKPWKDDDAKTMLHRPAAASDIGLHLERPLPPEWQRCLDIQSGRIHFYNTRTHRRTSRDPWESGADEEIPSTEFQPVSLDLELNLMCEPSPKSRGRGGGEGKAAAPEKPRACPCDCTGLAGAAALCKTPSWVSLDANDTGEMVATVCGRCHMLVMMSRSSPSCPNCKFSHPPDQMPSSAMFKPGAQALVL